jgi:Lon-like ATP-dependent protease
MFGQITSVFAAAGEEEQGLMAAFDPHRRIKITDLVQGGAKKAGSLVAASPIPPASPAPSSSSTPSPDLSPSINPVAPAPLLAHPTISIVSATGFPSIPIALGEDQKLNMNQVASAGVA